MATATLPVADHQLALAEVVEHVDRLPYRHSPLVRLWGRIQPAPERGKRGDVARPWPDGGDEPRSDGSRRGRLAGAQS